ncbi:MAG: alpha-galactosidase, partial [Lentisphaerae bacterium]|nr:alpha-galactosidase [Lentisphaerota bacterium]
FFDMDADCLGVAGNIPWTLNRQWAELLACSGTSFFASIKPGILSAGEFREMKEFFRLASEQTSRIEPLDWMHTTCPEEWLMNGKKRHFDWYAPEGADPDFIS